MRRVERTFPASSTPPLEARRGRELVGKSGGGDLRCGGASREEFRGGDAARTSRGGFYGADVEEVVGPGVAVVVRSLARHGRRRCARQRWHHAADGWATFVREREGGDGWLRVGLRPDVGLGPGLLGVSPFFCSDSFFFQNFN
jgi:hypothetical protein